ncbi:hypothetical protein AB1K84_08870 [Mesobacillus foraminis]
MKDHRKSNQKHSETNAIKNTDKGLRIIGKGDANLSPDAGKPLI